MVIGSVNNFIRQSVLPPTLKTMESIAWFVLFLAVSPGLAVGYKASFFCLRNMVEVWSKNETSITTKVNQIVFLFFGRKKLEAILEQWIKEAPGESRAQAKEEFLAFLDSNQKSDLNLFRLELTSLPDVFGFELFRNKLTLLDLRGNQIRNLPESLGNLQALMELDLTGNQIENLPDSLGNLQALTELDLAGNQIRNLPDSLGSLPALRKLDLGGNQIENLPDSLGSLPALRKLNLAGNQIENLPDSFGSLPTLTELDLAGNQIENLPDSLGSLPALRKLDLARNKIENLPESLGNLQALRKLDLARNKIENLPESLGNLQALMELNLERNQIRNLPKSLGNLRALKHLNLNKNPNSSGILRQILDLSPRCTVNLQGCNISQEILRETQGTMEPPAANQGPTIFLR